ncbi:maltose excess protein 1 chloroplastic [Phtheirospermum japonicum]|uniref:Maltose excess protein 1 chloroplastic n=1 Tax=Phtheirospermum japonicum TaxID=374723 RepID=A0A830CTM6_9LAMI|nr:maltose excess protein 1 chloroplastic [Phtheirospermum japonicum]
MASSLLLMDKVPPLLHGCRSSNCCFFSSYPQTHLRRVTNNKLHLKNIIYSAKLVCTCYRLKPVSAFSSEGAHPIDQEPKEIIRGKDFEQWDSVTAKLSGASNLPFFLLQLPQIILNARNLLAANKSALLAIPWLGMLTGLLGNLSLLSYFINKRESEAVVAQILGVVSLYVVTLQLAMAEAMPLPYFIATSIIIASGLVLNFMKYFDLLDAGLWHFWEEFITICGLSALPQARSGKLPEKGVEILGLLSGWTAILLFMWMPVAQMWTNILKPENIKGLSAVTMFLAMFGNGLMIPRALFVRDLMWFVGSSWTCVFYGWGNLVCLYCSNSISQEFILASTFGLVVWIGITFWRDARVRGHISPLTSFKELIFGH